MVEYIRDLRIKVDAKGHIFYLDVLAAVMHHIRGFNGVDLATISENTTNVLTSTLSNMVHPSLKRKMARSRIDTSDAELDLTHEMNAAIAIQHIWNTKKRGVNLKGPHRRRPLDSGLDTYSTSRSRSSGPPAGSRRAGP